MVHCRILAMIVLTKNHQREINAKVICSMPLETTVELYFSSPFDGLGLSILNFSPQP